MFPITYKHIMSCYSLNEPERHLKHSSREHVLVGTESWIHWKLHGRCCKPINSLETHHPQLSGWHQITWNSVWEGFFVCFVFLNTKCTVVPYQLQNLTRGSIELSQLCVCSALKALRRYTHHLEHTLKIFSSDNVHYSLRPVTVAHGPEACAELRNIVSIASVLLLSCHPSIHYL